VHRRANEPAVAEGYDRVREHLRAQLAQQFEAELAVMSAADRRIALAALDVMFQFEALDYLAVHCEMNDESLAKVLDRHVRAHLAAAG
jgi:hypothetical protein